MEDSEVTESTINMCKKAVKYYPNCGTVLQAYMHRSVSDIDLLKNPNTNIRLCKGAYKERKEIAIQDYQDIRENFLKCAEKMIKKGFQLVTIGSDQRYMTAASKEALSKLKKEAI